MIPTRLPLAILFAVSLAACGDKKADPGEPTAAAKPADESPTKAAAADPAPQAADAPAVANKPAAKPVVGPPCSLPVLKDIRARANDTLKGGDAKSAVKILESSKCDFSDDLPEKARDQVAWLISDLSYAYFKAGDFGSCHALALSHSAPYSGNVAASYDDTDKVIGALNHNANLCEKKLNAKYFSGFAEAPCSLAKDAFGIPNDALPSGADEACIEIVTGRTDEDDIFEGSTFVLLTKKGGAVKRTTLSFKGATKDDPESDSSTMDCNTQAVTFKKVGGKVRALFTGGGRDCSGGTAADQFWLSYELTGSQLRSVKKHVVWAH